MDVYGPTNAPGFAKHSSSFKNDERCTEVHFVVGKQYDAVLQQTRKYFQAEENGLIDYDVNWSSEGERWVGVTCKDI